MTDGVKGQENLAADEYDSDSDRTQEFSSQAYSDQLIFEVFFGLDALLIFNVHCARSNASFANVLFIVLRTSPHPLNLGATRCSPAPSPLPSR